MIISDRKVVVLPLRNAPGGPGILVIRNRSVVEPLQALFEEVWVSANPLGKKNLNYSHDLTDEERAVLEFLSLGHSDPEIADRLGISKRTLSRVKQPLMLKLGAKTSFEAAIKAVKNGWLSV
jgi:DNA-binding NarL/FixJ family response regulator